MADLTFSTTGVPEIARSGREAAPNPYAAPVDALAANWNDDKGRSAQAVSFILPDANGLNAAKRLIARAAHAHERSPRVTTGAETKAGLPVTFWLTTKVTRPRADKTAAAE